MIESWRCGAALRHGPRATSSSSDSDFLAGALLAIRQPERLYAHNLTFAPSQLIAAFTHQPLQALQSGQPHPSESTCSPGGPSPSRLCLPQPRLSRLSYDACTPKSTQRTYRNPLPSSRTPRLSSHSLAAKCHSTPKRSPTGTLSSPSHHHNYANSASNPLVAAVIYSIGATSSVKAPSELVVI